MIITDGKFTVYVHTNKINGKMYVGITKRKPINRWRNGNGYKENVLFNNAIQKYGWNNFDHEIIASKLTEEEACNMERMIIKQLSLQNDSYGYNLKDGGTSCSLTEETKRKIGDALRGRKYTEEKRKIYSESHKGKKLSSEHALAISKANKGRPKPEKWKQSMAGKLNKAVLCIETNEIFESMKSASESKNIQLSSISSCCHGKRNIAGGYHWKFV